jgi:hypothetical protein
MRRLIMTEDGPCLVLEKCPVCKVRDPVMGSDLCQVCLDRSANNRQPARGDQTVLGAF